MAVVTLMEVEGEVLMPIPSHLVESLNLKDEEVVTVFAEFGRLVVERLPSDRHIEELNAN